MFLRICFCLLAAGSSIVSAQDTPPKPAPSAAEAVTIWHEAKALVPTLVILPSDFKPDEVHTLIVALHGYGSSAEAFERVGRRLADAGFIVALPEAPYPMLVGQKLGYDWFLYRRGDDALQLRAGALESEDHLPAVVTDLRRRYRIDDVYVLGFSQGAIVAIVTGVNNNGLFDGIITFGLPAFDTAWFRDNALRTGRDLRILLVHGDKDERAPISMSERARDTFSAAGYDVTFRTFSGGHAVPNDELEFVQGWVHKDQEDQR